MSSAQNRLTLLCAVVVESVIVYSALAGVALLTGLESSPISWIAAAAIMMASFGVARALALIIMPVWMPYVIQSALGALTVYLALATQSLDLGWISAFFREDAPSHFARSAALGGFFGTVFWWRGGRLASTDFPSEQLSFSFKVGLIVLSIAAIVDIFHPANLRIFTLMFVFFAAGVAGLGVSNILPSSGAAAARQTWTRVIGGVVGVIVIVGFLFGILREGALKYISAPLGWLLNIIATVVFYVVIVPLVYVIEFLVSLAFRILRYFAGEREEAEVETELGIQESLRDLIENAEPSEPSIWMRLLAAIAVTFVVAALLVLLARAFRRRVRWLRVDEDGDRETLDEDFDAAEDFARLLFGLLPSRFRRRRRDARLRLPDDEPGIVDVFRIYFGMLRIAESRGAPRPRDRTPSEYRATLSGVFPERLANMATAAFNRACYGRRAASAEEISEMRQALERAERGR